MIPTQQMDERLSHREMADEMAKAVYEATTWMADHGQGPKRRPDHEIEAKRRRIDVLKQARDDYQAAAARKVG